MFAPSHPDQHAQLDTSLPAPGAARLPHHTRSVPTLHTPQESDIAPGAGDAEANPPQTAHKQKRPPAMAGLSERLQSSPRGLWPLSDPHHLKSSTYTKRCHPERSRGTLCFSFVFPTAGPCFLSSRDYVLLGLPLRRHALGMQMLQRLHPHFAALQGRNPFRGRSRR